MMAEVLAIVVAVTFGAAPEARGEELGVQVPAGFEVSLFADDELAHDIYSLTIDSFGRVVVSGAGYVRILVDTDNDGIADTARQFADGPRTGAQGMYFSGRDLICSGDAGLMRYRDDDGDDRADGPPEVFLSAKAGGEHDIHAIRQGPDGWWYVIAGNMAGITAKDVTLPNSPVTQPQAGALLRLKPDLSAAAVVAHGFRNAYDFDFHSHGDLFTFDSDGERDISLPWYRPTRVFHLLPGTHAGWVSRSWKRPQGFLDMPPVVASFGRGSPTGVVCYRHDQFPEKYRGALFVLDWTYGRVMAVPLARDGSVWKSEPEEFMSGVGQFGFAPTDTAVGPDGSLYVSVGGRGTRGSVYRVRWTTPEPSPVPPDELTQCLTARQPLSSWSRRIWEPIAARLGPAAFQEAARNEGRTDAERIRAIEIVTEKFGSLPRHMADRLFQSPSPLVRARAVWALGVTATGRSEPAEISDAALMARALDDADPLVARTALEVLLQSSPQALAPHTAVLSKLVASPEPFVRRTAARVLSRAEEKAFHQVADAAVRFGWRAALNVAWAFSMRSEGFDPYSVDMGRQILEGHQPLELKREAARLVQIGLGDVGPMPEIDPVFDGYHCRADLTEQTATVGALQAALVKLYPTGDASLDHELGRLMAMIEADDAPLFAKVLEQITADSDPVDDVHQLIVAARMPAERTPQQREFIAGALLALESKIESRGLNRDANWDDRFIEMYIGHVERDPDLPTAVLQRPEFGAPGHVPLAFIVEDDQLEETIDKFIVRIEADDDYRWTSDLVFLLGGSERAEVRDLLRTKAEDFAVRSAILTTLAESPEPQDRALFVSALDTHDLSVLSRLTTALETLEPDQGAAEQVALVRTLRRMGPRPEERAIQDAAVRLLQRNTGQDFGYEPGQPPRNRQTAAISQWSAWAESTFPDEWARQTGSTAEDIAALKARLDAVDWSAGDAARGLELFHKRSCAQCHGGRTAMGPNLTGAAGRFSIVDLFTAITMPNRDVSPRYQTTVFITRDGQVLTGLVIYESVDGLVLRTGANQTLRLETDEIEGRRRLNNSLMPAGLLKDLQPNDLADLYAYLRTLGAKTATAERKRSSQ